MFLSLLPAMLSIGLTTAYVTDVKPVSVPICCAKRTYCCTIKTSCCSKTVEAEVVPLSFNPSEAAKPTCCDKRGYCCTMKMACCGKEATAVR